MRYFIPLLLLSAVPALGADQIQPRVAWYGTLKSGLAEAKRTGRPILFTSGAPHCLGVPGIW